jgi:hypothetical protein
MGGSEAGFGVNKDGVLVDARRTFRREQQPGCGAVPENLVVGWPMTTIRKWEILFLLVLSCFASSAAAADSAGNGLRVDEERIQFHLLSRANLQFAIFNPRNKTITGTFAFELLDEKDLVCGSLTGTFSEKPGETVETLEWPASKLPSSSPSTLGWYRLLYIFFPSPESGLPVTGGIVQFGRVMRDGFELRMAAAEKVEPGTRYPVRLRALSLPEGKPLARQPIQVTMEIGDDDKKPVKRRATTDAAGNATVVFELPKKPEEQKGEITATIVRGAFEEEALIRFEFPEPPPPQITMSTDKPLYQPGQTVHVRMMAFGPDKRALEGKKIDLKIEDEEQEEQFHQIVTTSRFGIASADWEISNLMQLGVQTLTAKLVDEGKSNSGEAGTGAQIRVSRYELPTYTVLVEPDHPYYLPGQNATVDVHAEYLFGKPVQHGKVKVVKQQQRQWDYKTQKWEAEESEPVTGEIGGDGHYRAEINLFEEFKELAANSYERFRDVSLAAYVTDASTSRTEQRRFKVRITKEPIHLYVVGVSSESNAGGNSFYVTSSYADGSPASVDGEISAAMPIEEDEKGNRYDVARKTVVGQFHTNRHGIGRVELGTLPEPLVRVTHGPGRSFGDYYDSEEESTERNAMLLLEAKDRGGRQGSEKEEISAERNEDFLRVRTNHTLYHPDEPIEAEIVTNAKADEAIVSVWSREGLLRSLSVKLSEGRGKVSIPFEPRFHGEIYVSAYTMTEKKNTSGTLSGRRQVLFPTKEELDVKVGMRKAVYKPGEAVSSEFDVTTADGKPTESALGILVYDRAVAERVRTDEDFGRGYGFSVFDYFDWNYSQSIGGVSYRDLLNLDASKPFPEDLDLVAEGLVHSGYGRWWGEENGFDSSGWDGAGASQKFANELPAELQETKRALAIWATAKGEYPRDEAEVREALSAAGIDFDQVRDPWGRAFHLAFGVRGARKYLRFVSSGMDKRPGTEDDFVAGQSEWSYFTKPGMAIHKAAKEYAARTGKYVRDYATLLEETKKHGFDLGALRDPWGNPYRYEFDVEGNQFRIVVSSAGPDGIFDSKARRSWDDVPEYVSRVQYFTAESEALAKALAEQYTLSGKFPRNEEELKPVLERAKLTKEQLTDPWGQPYHFTFDKRSRYSDRVDVRTYTDPRGESRQGTQVTPVTQEVEYLTVLCLGRLGEKGVSVPFSVAEFNRVTAERSSKDIRTMPTREQKPLAGGRGAIAGVVTDAMGAVVTNATVTAESDTGITYTEHSDPQGTYEFFNLPVGIYELRCWASEFVTNTVLQVPVQPGDTTRVNFSLRVGASTETVEVSAEAIMLQTTSTELAVTSRSLFGLAGKAKPETAALMEKPLFTPKLRKYFPETLVWRPEVITDQNGHARIRFPMGDTITAWKMSVIASTVAGQIGVAEKELRSFQPFFVESDPPKVLTEGDQISQPVVLRNYLEKPQTIFAELQPEAWFSMVSKPQQRLTVEAGGDARAVFTYRAIHSAKKAKQRVTARNSSTGDAVEQELRVHPNGQEISFRASQMLGGTENGFKVRVPEGAINGSIEAEIRIYPNLMAHVLDAMEGIGKRPAGCAEQITSTAYVSLLALELLKKAGQENPGPKNPRSAVAAKARAAVLEGYAKLVQLQNLDGSLGYWYQWSGDAALTAYVLRFLKGASEFIAVDQSVVRRLRNYLLAHQVKPGSWGKYRWDLQKDVEDANTTAYVARALAEMDMTAADSTVSKEEREKEQEQVRVALDAGLRTLEGKIDSWSDAYLAGNYALAAVAGKRSEHIANARSLLKSLAHSEGDATYWNLEANTSPFYGWGSAGRLETTALAVEALAKMDPRREEQDMQELINRGLQYLLSHKDRYAVWYSTQATQNVLEAMIAAMPATRDAAKAMTATLRVNGREVKTLQLPSPQEATGPVTMGLANVLEKGENTIGVVGAGKLGAMNTVVFASYYLPWGESSATAAENPASGENRALQLKVDYDRHDTKAGETVSCTIGAERIGFKGYGMMLAEVGLPPGAEVDRASLEAAKESDAGVNSYEVLPDRVVFYVWPTAGGSKFGFGFRVRYGMESWSAPSSLYDYYNPEAAATVTPVKFSIQ